MAIDGMVPTADAGSIADGAAGDGDYLLCIDRDRSFKVKMPGTGELVIGRGAEAGLAIDDPLMSRAHAQLVMVPDGLRVSDLGSRHGTLVNGERLEEPRLVRSGDVITIGGTLLIVRRPSRIRPRDVAEPATLLRRLGEELARAAEYERELSLLIVRHGLRPDQIGTTFAPHLRVIDTVAPIDKQHVAVLLPELGREEATRRAGVLAEIGMAAGTATAPFDGIDADTLLAAARSACDRATDGTVALANQPRVIVAGTHRIVIADPAVIQLYELAQRLAKATVPILILGETGAGKELVAAAIHAASARAKGPFVAVNCAAIPETLAESELFGYAKGAFSGAVAAKAGYLEAASGGTIFLDELGELSAATQARLLRVLETGELIRIGEVAPRRIDLRIVAATNRDLQREIDEGRFRSDLYFRLGSARLELPALRDRPRDLAILSAHLLDDACTRLGRPQLELSVGAALALFRHGWPGNIRELRHVIEYAAAAAPDGVAEIEIWHLPASLAAAARQARNTVDGTAPAAAPPPARPPPGAPTFRPIADEVRELERGRMIAALRASGGARNRAADLIEMPLRTFVTKLKRYAISDREWQP